MNNVDRSISLFIKKMKSDPLDRIDVELLDID